MIGAVLVLALIIIWISLLKSKKEPVIPKKIEEEKSVEDLLKELTPTNAKPFSPEEQKEIEKTLKLIIY